MGTVAGADDHLQLNARREQPVKVKHDHGHDGGSQTSEKPPTTSNGRHTDAAGLENDFRDFLLKMEVLEAHISRSRHAANEDLVNVEDSQVLQYAADIDTLISELLQTIRRPGHESESGTFQQNMTDMSTRVVGILDSDFIRTICKRNLENETGRTFSQVCSDHFSQVLMWLMNQSEQRIVKANHLENKRGLRDDVVRRVSADTKFVLLLPLLKQLGKLAFLDISAMKLTLENFCLTLFNNTERNSKRLAFLVKTLLELLHEQGINDEDGACNEVPTFVGKFHTEFARWLIDLTNSTRDAQEILPYLIVYCDYNSVLEDRRPQPSAQSGEVCKAGGWRNGMTLLQLKNLVNEKFIECIRKSLIHDDLHSRKQGLFVLKSIISFMRIKVGLFFGPKELSSSQEQEKWKDLELVKISDKFDEHTLFWSTFFELFDILDEKQIHIIEPCLPKLEVFEDGKYPAQLVLPWYCALLHKMCHHDNRFIANQGIMRFLKSAPGLLSTENRGKEIELSMEFIEFTVLPNVREKVGWLFRTGQEYFKCTKQLGSLVALLMGSDLFQTTKFLMGYVVRNCGLKTMSPNSLFFMTSALCHAVFQETGIVNFVRKPTKCLPGAASTVLDDLNCCVTYFNEYLKKGLPILDKFLKIEGQYHLIEAFCALMKKAMKYEIDFGMPFCAQGPDSCQQQTWLSSTLRFLASIDYVLFSESASLLQLCQEMSKLIFRNSEDFNFRKKCGNLNSLETCGFMRLYFCKVCKDFELMASHVKVDHHPYEVFSQLLSFGNITYFCDPLSDFLKCALHRQYANQDHADNFGVKNCWNLLTKLFLKCLLLQEGENAFDSPPSATELHINSTITLLDVIVRSLPLPVIQHLNLRDETEELQSFLMAMREGLEWSDDVYMDKIQFRFFIIFAKLNQIYGLPIVPAFHISNLCDAFKNTDIYASTSDLEISSPFKAEFQEQRLAALTQALFANPKQDVLKCIRLERTKPSPFCWWSSILDLVDKSGLHGIIPILDFASGLLSFESAPNGDTDQNILQFVEMSWKSVFEMRKTESFWVGFRKYVDFILDPYFANSGVLRTKSAEIFEKSERIVGLSQILMAKVETLDVHDIRRSEAFLQEIVDISIQALYFGPMLLDSYKSTFELWNYLVHIENGEMEDNDYCDFRERNVSVAFSIFDSNSKTRLLGLEVIMKILNSLKSAHDKKFEEILAKVVYKLLDRNDEESKNRKRYFGDSATHRCKQRITQSLLVLQPYFASDLAQTVTTRMLNSLAGDNPQPSVRYMMEWIVVKNLIMFPTCSVYHGFFETSKKCSSTRIGFGAFFATICLHVVLSMSRQDALQIFCHEVLSALSVLVMGQHSTVRPHAQICFCRIYKHLRDLALNEQLLMKFETLYQSLESHLQSSGESTSYMYQKVENNFYLKFFSPMKHYTPKTIFIELPKLANVSEDELAQPRDLNALNRLFQCDQEVVDLTLPTYRDLDKLSWHKTTLRDGREMGDEDCLVPDQLANTDVDTAGVYQKKINPWKYLPISEEISDFPEELQIKKRNSVEEGLVLVATLLEKTPNLGGLCRTCEIFGVSKYVISSLRHLADQTFQNLSVSSEKWVNIVEVPKYTLREFLATYSSKGYTILGIEQVSESVPLNSYKFPKKCVLLLGHEKFGIPSELLQVVDQCLEIPQVGVTRSLNVHVTGALCVWQYASQHSLQGNIP